MNKFPIYIPSKARPECPVAKLLQKEEIPFYIVVENRDYKDYWQNFHKNKILILDKEDQGVAYVRNFIKQHSKKNGDEYHWQLDDNIKNFRKRENNKNQKNDALKNIQEIEDYTTQFSNISISGMCYTIFAFSQKKDISINRSPASAVLVNNNINVWWRKNVVVDVDYTLQTLTLGYCTLVFNRILIDKPSPMTMKGGCTEIEYSNGRREKRTKNLKLLWNDLVQIKYKYGRIGLKLGSFRKKFPQIPK